MNIDNFKTLVKESFARMCRAKVIDTQCLHYTHSYLVDLKQPDHKYKSYLFCILNVYE